MEIQAVNEGLDKRVNEVEAELKVVKGEIKELLVDIRDLVNRNENPFYNVQRHGFSRLETKENGIETKNQLPADKEKKDQKLSSGVPEIELENEINKEIAQQPVSTVSPDEGPEENMGNQFRKMDTYTLVELMRWVDYAVRTVGHNNLKVLLELYARTGQLPEEAKCIIENIANLPIDELAGEEKVNMKDNITVLAQLNAIINPGGFRSKVQPLY
jgi:archaellum component FlaD/FlaE